MYSMNKTFQDQIKRLGFKRIFENGGENIDAGKLSLSYHLDMHYFIALQLNRQFIFCPWKSLFQNESVTSHK